MAARRPATASGVALCPRTTSATSPGSMVVATNTATDTNRRVPSAITTRQPTRAGSDAMRDCLPLSGVEPDLVGEVVTHEIAQRDRRQAFQLVGMGVKCG